MSIRTSPFGLLFGLTVILIVFGPELPELLGLHGPFPVEPLQGLAVDIWISLRGLAVNIWISLRSTFPVTVVIIVFMWWSNQRLNEIAQFHECTGHQLDRTNRTLLSIERRFDSIERQIDDGMVGIASGQRQIQSELLQLQDTVTVGNQAVQEVRRSVRVSRRNTSRVVHEGFAQTSFDIHQSRVVLTNDIHTTYGQLVENMRDVFERLAPPSSRQAARFTETSSRRSQDRPSHNQVHTLSSPRHSNWGVMVVDQ